MSGVGLHFLFATFSSIPFVFFSPFFGAYVHWAMAMALPMCGPSMCITFK